MLDTTQAVWFTAPRTVALLEQEVPPPAAGMVRVTTIASAVSHGTEMLVYRGQVPPDLPLDLPTLAGSFAFPIKYGYAAVGRVRDVGPDVTTLAVGDLVFALHPHQGTFSVPEAFPVRLPPTLDPEVGLFTANLETAFNIIHDTPLHLGETVLVVGQGVVGLLVTQLAKRAGARRVFAVEPHAHRRALAQQRGADAAFAPGADLVSQIREHNDGRAADVVIEVSGAPAALQQAIDAVLPGGTVVVGSWYGTKPVTLELGSHFHRGRVHLRSSQVGRLNPELGERWDYARRTAAVVALLPELQLAHLISHRFPFAQAANAYQFVDSRPDLATQVALVYDQGET